MNCGNDSHLSPVLKRGQVDGKSPTFNSESCPGMDRFPSRDSCPALRLLPMICCLDTVFEMPDNLYIFVNWACGVILAATLLKRVAPQWPICERLFSRKMRPIRIAFLVAVLAVAALEFFHTTLYEPMFLRAQKDDPTLQLSKGARPNADNFAKLPKSLDFAEYWLGSIDLALGHNIYRDMAEYIHFKAAEHEKDGRDVSMAKYADYEPTGKEGYERLQKLAEQNGIPVFPHFTYPPTWYLLFIPFTSMDWRDAHDLWLCANLIFVAAAVVLVLLAAGYRPRSNEETLALIALILGYSPLIFALKECQANSLVLFIVCAALLLASRRKCALAGALIAFGAAVKVFPGILLLYFLWKRKFRLAVWGFASLAAIMLLSIAAVGWDVHYWYFFNVAPTWASNIRAFDMNQSIAGVIARALVGGEGIAPITHSPGLARAMIAFFQIALLLILLGVSRGHVRRFTNRVWLEIGLVIVFYQLASTWVLIHHLQWLLIPLLLIWAIEAKNPSCFSRPILIAFALSYLLTGVKYIYYREAFRAGPMALFASLKCFAMIVLFFALVAAIRRSGSEAGT